MMSLAGARLVFRNVVGAVFFEYEFRQILSRRFDAEEAAVDEQVRMVEIAWQITGITNLVGVAGPVNVTYHFLSRPFVHLESLDAVLEAFFIGCIDEDAQQVLGTFQDRIGTAADDNARLGIG